MSIIMLLSLDTNCLCAPLCLRTLISRWMASSVGRIAQIPLFLILISLIGFVNPTNRNNLNIQYFLFHSPLVEHSCCIWCPYQDNMLFSNTMTPARNAKCLVFQFLRERCLWGKLIDFAFYKGNCPHGFSQILLPGIFLVSWKHSRQLILFDMSTGQCFLFLFLSTLNNFRSLARSICTLALIW